MLILLTTTLLENVKKGIPPADSLIAASIITFVVHLLFKRVIVSVFVGVVVIELMKRLGL
tara:strand:+ start:1045 stop:1224 length:180 start_codon:yes stop_codon:yes gene_type:complete